MKALLKNYHQSPRKVRLVADMIRGKSVSDARAALLYLPKKSAPALGKLLDSAVANARIGGHAAEGLFVKTITVDKGTVMRRYRPFARGRSGTLHKTMSIVKVELGALSAPKKAAKKVAKPSAAKKATGKKLQATG
ncbi:MAG: 50S ribosomal protein L22 [Patescibacteria group bacterium]|nr:50S ribosomal protein L22 [bacterium]MDZ4227507.1 50S ribosomal protein L22 [Patescibacteria group bacterium]